VERSRGLGTLGALLAALISLPSCGGDDASPTGPGESSTCTQTRSGSPGEVLTTSGLVQGRAAGRTWAWQGIPFAAPPVGSLRFAPPQDAPCWQGIKQTTSFGPACLQRTETGETIGSEDCLTLNVWAPDGATAAAALPVLVFIHGGGHQQGSASQQLPGGSPMYDGQRFVERASAIMVTIEYRLGPFGFLAHPALTAERPEKSGNYGMLDQLFALRWVRNNIENFGGDPDRVLVFGESAGAVSTCRLLASPLAAGMFSAAIVESGACVAKPLAEAEANGLAVASAVGCSDSGSAAACLRDAGVEAVMATVSPLEGESLRQQYDGVIDGYALTGEPIAVIESGSHNHLPVIIGTNTEEQGRNAPLAMTEEQYVEAVRAYAASLGAPGLANLLLAQYPSSSYASPRAAYVALTTDIKFTCPGRKALQAFDRGQAEPVYRYVFSHVADNAAPRVKALGATHGLELGFVFDVLPNPGPGDEVVTTALNGYWSRLAASGDPNGEGALAWPLYDRTSEEHMRLESPLAVESAYRAAQCDFLESLGQR
jgi:para-nitrobenzyl esterase